MKIDWKNKNTVWSIISYHNERSDLIGALRVRELHTFLKSKGLSVEFITRSNGGKDSDVVIKETKIVQRWNQLFNFLCLPDASMVWAWSVANYLKQRKNEIIIFTSMPPYGLCWIGLLLRFYKKSIFWVVDFRDPWTLNVLYRPFFSFLKIPLAKLLEQQTLKKANLVLLNTDTDREKYIAKYPGIENKCITIRNGFNQIVKNKKMKNSTGEPIRIVYAGGTYRNGEVPLAISNFLTEINSAQYSFVCDFYGEFHASITQAAYVNYKGVFPQEKIPTILSEYALGIIYLPKENINSGRITQKFYDYIGSGLHPIVINPSVEIEKIMSSLSIGLMIKPDMNYSSIAKKLYNIFKTDITLTDDQLAPFHRSFQFEKLINYFSKSERF